MDRLMVNLKGLENFIKEKERWMHSEMSIHL